MLFFFTLSAALLALRIWSTRPQNEDANPYWLDAIESAPPTFK
jgi:hypothetical protein